MTQTHGTAQQAHESGEPDSLAGPLKRFFGHDRLRPIQDRAVADTIEGRDVFVIMPTGGGKSLCYQLPAVLETGTTVVICPLIALMQNQVELLCANGIRATLLNSTLAPQEAAEREREAFALTRRGKYRSAAGGESLRRPPPQRTGAD